MNSSSQVCKRYLKLYSKMKNDIITDKELEEMNELIDQINSIQTEEQQMDDFLNKVNNMF